MPARPWRNMAWSSASSTLMGPFAFSLSAKTHLCSLSASRRVVYLLHVRATRLGAFGAGGCVPWHHPLVWALCIGVRGSENAQKLAGKVPKDNPYRGCTSLSATVGFSDRHGPTEGENAIDMGTQPYALASEEGKAVWFLGTLVLMKATGEQTGGALGVIDNLMA